MALFQVEMFSQALGRTVSLTAIVPTDRRWDGKPLRSLYLLHGYGAMHTEWLLNVPTVELSARYNMAIFMISGENACYIDDEIRGVMYTKFLCEELIAFTRRTFPLSERCEDTSICGQSMGGYGALRNGLLHSEVFGNVIPLSAAMIDEFVIDEPPTSGKFLAPYSYYMHTFGQRETVAGSDRHCRAVAKAMVDEKKPLPRIFIACGTEDDCIHGCTGIHEYLNELGVPHEFYTAPGRHDWVFWNSVIDRVMTWITEA